MIIRNKEGKIIILNKNNYTSDKIYNKTIYDNLKINNDELNKNNSNNNKNSFNYSDFLIKNILKSK
jgi:hypothetical protein